MTGDGAVALNAIKCLARQSHMNQAGSLAFILYKRGKLKDGLEFTIYLQQRTFGSGPGDGRVFCLPGQRTCRAGDEKKENVRYRRGVCCVSVCHAHDRLDLCTHHCGIFSGF